MVNEYLKNLESQLDDSPYVDILTTLKLEIGVAWGHIRLRGTLINGDIFEVAEYIRLTQVRYLRHGNNFGTQKCQNEQTLKKY